MADTPVLTIEDANRRLPLVTAICRDVMELRADIDLRRERLRGLRDVSVESDSEQSSLYAEEVLHAEEAIEDDEIRIDSFAAELEEIGARLADAVKGLVEFDSELDGQPVCLSWAYGEPEVGFWRSTDETPSDRRPLILNEQT